jgi:hypothetical protein
MYDEYAAVKLQEVRRAQRLDDDLEMLFDKSEQCPVGYVARADQQQTSR